MKVETAETFCIGVFQVALKVLSESWRISSKEGANRWADAPEQTRATTRNNQTLMSALPHNGPSPLPPNLRSPAPQPHESNRALFSG